jgi:antitoxin component YwqK of YwqJK toxin-antitoxin module
MPWLILLAVSLATLVVLASYRLLWRHRYGVTNVQGRCLRLRGRVAGPGEHGTAVCRSSLSGAVLLGAPFELMTDSGARYRVALDSAHLVATGGTIRVGDRATVVALHSAMILEESLYRQSALQPAVAALRISRGVWPEARGLNYALGLALLFVVSSLGGALRGAPASAGISCPAGTRSRGGRPPVDHFQWCSVEVSRGREIRQGPWLVWWDATHKQQEGTFRDDRAQGEWRRWDINGRLVEIATYSEGTLQRRTRFWADGRLSRDAHYKGELLEGVERQFDQRGRLRLVRNYSAGRLEGRSASWSADGRLLLVAHYSQGRLHGPWRRWHFSGKLAESGEHRSGEKQGRWTAWDERGRLQRQGAYDAGQRRGEWRFWYADGRLRARGSYRDHEGSGVVDGHWTWWHVAGRVAGQGHYRLGRKVGLWSAWHDNGVLRRQGEYRDGEEDGLWTAWDRSGRKWREGRYRAGIAVGRWLADSEHCRALLVSCR